jgi:hypothetical protein
MISPDSDLPTVLADMSRLTDETRRVFGALSAAQLNWKPSAGEWSIGQCLDHLVIANRPYVAIFEDVLAGRRRPSAWERVPLLPRIFGRLLINTLRPDSRRKVSAPRALTPSTSDLAPSIVTTFLELQERLRGLMEASRPLDLDRLVVTSPYARVVTYSAMDACRLIVVHEQNHVLQATRVMESPGFPAGRPL